jgi:RNA polymerase sigma-70 factor (ECF subfamily)
MDPTITQARSGDKQALSRLLMDHRALVGSVVQRFAWEASQRPDLAQAVMLKAVQSIREFRNGCAFATWLYRIAVNVCTDANRGVVRDRKRRGGGEDALAVFPDLNAPDGLAAAESSEIRLRVQKAVKALPLGERTAFTLFYFAGYSGKEIAEAMSISEPNVFMKLKGGRDKVREVLRSSGVTP